MISELKALAEQMSKETVGQVAWDRNDLVFREFFDESEWYAMERVGWSKEV